MVTYTVDTDGTSGTYSSQAAAVAALPDPFTDDYKISCSATTSVKDTNAVSIDLDTTSDYRLYIERADDNYVLSLAGGDEIEISQTYGNVYNITIDGLMIEQSSASGNYQHMLYIDAIRDGRVIIKNCTIESYDTSTYRARMIYLGAMDSYDVEVVLVNNIIISGSDVGHVANSIIFAAYDTVSYIYNNTFVGYNLIYAAGTIDNLLFINNIFDFDNALGDTLSSGSDYNSTSLSSGLSGSNDRESQTFSFDSDYRLQSGDTGAKDHGTDLSSDSNYSFSDDIDGNTRSGTWDIGASEYTSSGSSYTRTVTNSIGVSDSLSRTVSYSRSNDETVGITDTMNRIAQSIRSIDETVGITDTMNRIAQSIRSIDDAVGITDALSFVKAIMVSVSDAVGITDAVSRTVSFARSIPDSIGITDTVSRVQSVFRSVADSIGVTDVLSRTASYFRTKADSIGITDDMSYTEIANLIVRTISDAVGITDSVSRSVSFVRSILNTVGITDGVSRAVQFFRGVVDSIGIMDLIRALSSAFRTYINTGTYSVNKYIDTGSISVNKYIDTGSISVNKYIDTGTKTI